MDLGQSVQTGVSAFEHIHGVQWFEYLDQHAEERNIVVDAMRSYTVDTGAALAKTYDFSGLGTLADIGGSQGLILSLVLPKYPSLRGILFDLPKVIEGAPQFLKSCGLGHRVECKGGSFFEAVPSGADAYLLKHILHDWGDEDCVRILKNIRNAAKPGAKLLIVDPVVTQSNEPQPAKALDIQMLALTHGGKERTQTEWRDLLNAGDFQLTRVVPTGSPTSVVEAICR